MSEKELYSHLGELTKDKVQWKENITFVASLLKGQSIKIIGKSLWLLGEMGMLYPEEISPFVEQIAAFLKSNDELLKERALNALGRIGRSDYELIKPYWDEMFLLATDDSPSVRLSFIWASENIATNTPEAYEHFIPIFEKLLDDKNVRVRMEAPEMFRVLGKRKPNFVRHSLDKLKSLSEEDDDRVVRIHAIGAINAITKIIRIRCGNVNCYVVVNGNNAVLVDTGKEKYRNKVLSVCKNYSIRLIILTHGHIDHVQNAAYLKEKLQVPIAMSKDDLSLLESNTNQELFARGFLGKIMLSFSQKSFRRDKIPTFLPDIFLNDGDTLIEYGIPAKIISLQGHTKGSIGIDIEKEFLLVGDALMNMFYPCCSLLYNEQKAVQESAKKISILGNRTIFFGHGKPTKNKVWSCTK